MAHAVIAPSSLAMTVACPASVKLQASLPPLPETEEEAEGTAAHWVALSYAAGNRYPVGTEFNLNGRVWTIDEEMEYGALMYVEAIGGPHSSLRLEDPVTIPRIHPTLCWGTPDAWRYIPDYYIANLDRIVKLLRVADYKYGHRFIEVYDNYQLVAYVAGIMERLQLDDNDEDLWLELILVQPRNYHRDGPVRRWLIHASEIRALVNIAYNAAQEALGDTPRAITSEHCRDCRARVNCRTYQTQSMSLVDFSSSAELVQLSSEAIGHELALVEDAIKRLEGRKTGLAMHAETHLRQGHRVANYHMEPGESRLIYKDDVTAEEIIGMGELFGVNLRKQETLKNQLLTPNQAKQKGIDEKIIAQYAYRPPAGMKLTRDDLLTTRKVFSK